MRTSYFINFLLFLLFFVTSTNLSAQDLRRRYFFGLRPSPVTEDVAKSKGMEKAEGMLINAVAPNSTEANLNIVQGDILLAINGNPINTFKALFKQIIKLRAGDNVVFTIFRDGKRNDIEGEILPLPYESSETQEIIYRRF